MFHAFLKPLRYQAPILFLSAPYNTRTTIIASGIQRLLTIHYHNLVLPGLGQYVRGTLPEKGSMIYSF
jgi:hypothetical protein